jgi:hypothetical protein
MPLVPANIRFGGNSGNLAAVTSLLTQSGHSDLRFLTWIKFKVVAHELSSIRLAFYEKRHGATMTCCKKIDMFDTKLRSSLTPVQ